jgi:rubrerythrin
MGPIEALELALKKEVEAATLYQRLLAEYPIAEDIFSFLITEEEKHQQLIRKKIVELTK